MEVDLLANIALQLFRVGDSIHERSQSALINCENDLDQIFLLARIFNRSGGNWIITGIAAELLDSGSG